MIFGVNNDMTRLEFKSICEEVGLYCFARGGVEREGNHFRITFGRRVSAEWEKLDVGVGEETRLEGVHSK